MGSRVITRRIKLRSLLFGFLVIFGSLPLVISSITTIAQNREGLETQEKVALADEAELISQEVTDFLIGVRRQLRQLGVGLSSLPAAGRIGAAARRQWIETYVGSFQLETQQRFGTRVVDLRDGRQFGTPAGWVQEAMDGALAQVRSGTQGDYELVNRGRDELPAVILTEPVLVEEGGGAELVYVLQAVAELPIRGAQGDVFILDVEEGGKVLWSSGTEAEVVTRAVTSTELVRSYVEAPIGIRIDEYAMRVGRNRQRMIGQIGPLGGTGWAVLVHKPKAAAFLAVQRLVRTTVYAAILMVVLALLFAAVATRLIGQPIQRLATTSKEIAAGSFGLRVEPSGFGSEIADLAESFNLMSGHVEDYVRRLRDAVQVNRELFIGSIRAFLAAIEAKEPYTRGHSERVASISQAITRQLELSREFEEKIWIAGLLHDVGKIGIEDRVLNKGDILTDEEYEIMKRHPVIGAEIMSSIEQMREMLPAIRWHHEKWNGKGYPDGLSGQQIPLMARVVAVADTFDAITTQRVYQDPFTTDEALEIIRKLDGIGFDPEVVAAFFSALEAGDIEVMPTVTTGSGRQHEVNAEAALHT